MASDARKKGNAKAADADALPLGAAASRWEWVAAGVGLLLVLGTVGSIGYKALTTEGATPVVTIEPLGIVPTTGGYVVKFSARNTSSWTAAGLTVAGALREGATVVETSEVVLDYLAENSVRHGGLIFQNDPSGYELSLEAKGYADP